MFSTFPSVFDLDGALLFHIDVWDIRVADMAVLADELFVLGQPHEARPLSKLDLCVHSAHDGTGLRRINVFVEDPCFTLMRASPSEGLLWLIFWPSNTIQRIKPDFTPFHSQTPKPPHHEVVWEMGQAIDISYHVSIVALDLSPSSSTLPQVKKRKTPLLNDTQTFFLTTKMSY